MVSSKIIIINLCCTFTDNLGKKSQSTRNAYTGFLGNWQTAVGSSSWLFYSKENVGATHELQQQKLCTCVKDSQFQSAP